MEKFLEALNLTKIATALTPAALITVWRSFVLKGTFPTIGKDDLGALVLTGTVYFLFWLLFGVKITAVDFISSHNIAIAFAILIFAPSAVGVALGVLESGDWIARPLRRARLRVPSPHATAWSTLFRELNEWDLLVVYIKDFEEPTCGRWTAGSSASLDEDHIDLYISECGTLSESGDYEPFDPPRGFYLREADIKAIEIIRVPKVRYGWKRRFKRQAVVLRRRYRETFS